MRKLLFRLRLWYLRRVCKGGGHVWGTWGKWTWISGARRRIRTCERCLTLQVTTKPKNQSRIRVRGAGILVKRLPYITRSFKA